MNNPRMSASYKKTDEKSQFTLFELWVKKLCKFLRNSFQQLFWIFRWKDLINFFSQLAGDQCILSIETLSREGIVQ